MTHAIRIHQIGGPEVMRWEPIDVGPPGPGQARIRHHAVGVNFVDIYQRSGLYPLELPTVLGQEGAGEVVAVGPGVTEVQPGDRVAYAGPTGAYAQERLIQADRLVKLPDDISYETAAAMMLKGMTASYLLRHTHRVQPGETIVFHAAAGGVGLIAVQWAKALGAVVIGTVGSREKAELARRAGADHVVITREEKLSERVKDITSGRGVPVVYDSVGAATFDESLASLEARGLLVSFGQASGKVPPFDITVLGGARSLYLTRPSLHAYTRTRAELEDNARALFDVVRSGKVKIEIHQRYRLEDAAQAHRDLAARKTTGSTVLTV
ncbi:MAG: quinone oxidoreductase [Myxococcaceae bacterium]|nr:quinone oxidoreductase [Myxococcaceae bacterium]